MTAPAAPKKSEITVISVDGVMRTTEVQTHEDELTREMPIYHFRESLTKGSSTFFSAKLELDSYTINKTSVTAPKVK